MHKTKVDQYRKQIRKQQLKEYFKKRRKQLTSIPTISSSLNPMQTIHHLNVQIHKAIQDNKMINQKNTYTMGLQDLVTVAKFTQTQFGVECLLKTDIPVLVLPFLTPTYYNRLEQYMATCIFVNITYIRPQKRPSDQFLRNITNILQNTSTYNQQSSQQQYTNPLSTAQLLDTIDNCLLIIYHLMVDFTEVVRFYVQDCELLNLLYGLIQAPLSSPCIEKILKMMTFINQYYLQKLNKRPVRRFLKFYINIMQNTNDFRFIFLALSNIQSLMSIYCQSILHQQSLSSYKRSNKSQIHTQMQKEFSDIQGQIQKSHFLSRITALFTYLQKRKLLSKQLLAIMKMLIPGLGLKTIQQKVLLLLNKIGDELYRQQQQKMQEFINENEQQHHQRMKPNESLMDMRLQFYQVIYQILSIWGSQHQVVTKNSLFTKIIQHYSDFQSTHSALNIQQNSFRKAFIYIFGVLTFSGSIKYQEIYLLKVSIEKYRKSSQLMAIDYENQDQSLSQSSFEAFIDTVLVNIDDFQHNQYF